MKEPNHNSEQGITSDRYQLIPRCLIFIRKGDSFLLIKGAPNKKIWPNKFNGIGGHIERDEDVKTAAQRELFEETGLSTELSLKGIVTVDPGGETGVGIFIFSGEYTSGVLKASSEGELHWVDISDLGNLPVVPDVEVLLGRVHKMKENSQPFSAHSFYDPEGKFIIKFHD